MAQQHREMRARYVQASVRRHRRGNDQLFTMHQSELANRKQCTLKNINNNV